MSAATTPGKALRALVLFMVCLSIAGTLVAGAHWFVVDKPQQDALKNTAPENCGTTSLDCPACLSICYPLKGYYACQDYCEQIGSCGVSI